MKLSLFKDDMNGFSFTCFISSIFLAQQISRRVLTQVSYLRPSSWTIFRQKCLSFPPSYSQLCLEISISSNSRNLLCISSNPCNLLRIATVQLLYIVKEKGGKNLKQRGSVVLQVSQCP